MGENLNRGFPMRPVEQRTLRQPHEVDLRVAEMDLSREKLLRVRDMALGAGADVNDFFCSNSAGTFKHHYGVFGLRSEFVGKNWRLDRPNNIEIIRHATKNLMVAYSNVDIACNDANEPKPISDKGSGAERAAQGNLFGKLPIFIERQDGLWTLYYLMVAESGAAEISCPVVENNTFVTCVERIY